MASLTTARHRATRSFQLLRAGAVAFAAIGAAGFTMLIAGVASADDAPTPRLVTGNAATCEDAGLTGEILFGGGSGSASDVEGSGTITGTSLDVTINEGYTASGIVVKGGPDANVYDGPFVGPVTIEDMVAPLNPGGQVPAVSHWYVCGGTTPPSSPSPTPSETPSESPTPSPTPSETPSESPTPSPTPSETPSESPTPSPSGTTPSSPAPSTSSAPPPPGELPKTGIRSGLMVISGAALLASGGMLIALAHQRRRFVA